MKRPALFILLYTLIGILFALNFVDTKSGLYFLFTIIIITLIITIYYKNSGYLMLISISIIAFIFSLNTGLHKNTNLNNIADKDYPVTLEGTVNSIVAKYDDVYLYKVSSTNINFKKYSTNERINIYVYTDKKLEIGDIIKTKSPLLFPSKKRNYSDFNAPIQYAIQNIEYKMYPDKVYVKGHKDTFMYYLNKISNKLEQRIYKIYNNTDSGILTAMTLGNRQNINEEIYSLYKYAGIVHIIAISGLHISIFCSILFFMLRPFGKNLSAIIIMLFLVFYTVFTGSSISVLRASIMTSFFILSGIVGRKYDLLSSTAMACSILLINNPYYVYDLGFQYSFIAVFAIGLSANILKKYNIKNKYLSVFITSLIVSFATKPITIYNFYYINFIDVFTNIIAITLVEIILICGLFSIAISCLSMNFATIFALPVHYLLLLIEKSATLSLKFPISHINTGGFSIIIIILMYIVFIVFYNLLIKRKTYCVTFIICITVLASFYIKNYSYKGFEAIFYYVGQGDCIILKDNNKCYLMDAGSSLYSPKGNKILKELKYENINKIDGIYISHMDFDHMGAILELAGNIDIDRVILSKYCTHNNNYYKLVEKLNQNNINIEYVDENYKENISNTTTIELIGVDKNATKTNNSSPIYKVTSNNKSILFTGDIDTETEEKFLDCNIDADILKVPHHGAESSISEKFIKAVSPESAICSAGYMNSYGHPSDKTLILYNNMNIPFFSTEYNGQIRVRFQNNVIKYKFLNTNYNTIDNYIRKND